MPSKTRKPAASLVLPTIPEVASSENRPIIQSDRGDHYRWPRWLTKMREAKQIRSMSRKGSSPDNAAFEGFFG